MKFRIIRVFSTLIKAQVQKECGDMFLAEWLSDCTDVLDPSQTIADCEVDYCMDKTTETMKEIVSKFIDDCAKKVDPGTTAVCDWPVLSGLASPTCGENQKWKGCADSCADVVECGESAKECPEEPEYVPLCVCLDGYVMSDGACILESNCPVGAVATAWSIWSTCTKTCDEGKKSRSRVCLGPGVCEDAMEETIPCNTCGCLEQTSMKFTTDTNYQIAHFLWHDGYSTFGDIHFSVDATEDIRLTLSPDTPPTSGFWEVVLGGSGGSVSHIELNGGMRKSVSHTNLEFDTWKRSFFLSFSDTYIGLLDSDKNVIIDLDQFVLGTTLYLHISSGVAADWRVIPFPGKKVFRGQKEDAIVEFVGGWYPTLTPNLMNLFDNNLGTIWHALDGTAEQGVIITFYKPIIFDRIRIKDRGCCNAACDCKNRYRNVCLYINDVKVNCADTETFGFISGDFIEWAWPGATGMKFELKWEDAPMWAAFPEPELENWQIPDTIKY